MHDGEVDIDVELVGRLVAEQFPELSDLPLSACPSTGTVNVIYRLGGHLCVRLPRVRQWADDLDNEWQWLPKLAPGLTLRVPEPVEKGEPSSVYPFSWAIYRWIEGQPYADELVDDERQAASDLAQFVAELRQMHPAVGVRQAGRKPLRELDTVTRAAFQSARDVIDSDAATAAWELSLGAPTWSGAPVWIHGDLLRPNVLVDRGRLCAVIDFGSVGVGDPASDVAAAWGVFGPTGRDTFRSALGVDDAMWSRARGLALHQAAMIIPYYAETNPPFVASALRVVAEVLADVEPAGQSGTASAPEVADSPAQTDHGEDTTRP